MRRRGRKSMSGFLTRLDIGFSIPTHWLETYTGIPPHRTSAHLGPRRFGSPHGKIFSSGRTTLAAQVRCGVRPDCSVRYRFAVH